MTVRQAIDLYSRLGLPHFQRGRVWGNDSVSALLESLFFNTPCGSFVFWKSKDNRANGVAFDSASREAPDYLVIDGQQRIRSLRDAWTDTAADDEADGKSRVWCLNLSRVPELEALLEQSRKTPTLFVWARDPADPEIAAQARRYNLIPWRVVRSASEWSHLEDYRAWIKWRGGAGPETSDSRMEAAYLELRKRVLAIADRSFFVEHRDETRDDSHSLAEMAELYNRINAGGKQVETEERAFAALVGLQPGSTAVSDGLRRAFKTTHGEVQGLAERDARLKREEERQFGFKLFIRVFLQVCQYHLGFGVGKSSFSFDPVGRDDFRLAFGALQAESVEKLWEETRAVLGCLRDVLDSELKCDDLRMLPDAKGLMPLAQLLIQYPDLRAPSYRALVASLALRIILADPDSREWGRLVVEAGDPTRNGVQAVERLVDSVRQSAASGLRDAMKRKEGSLQDRHVLLLYWLQRKLSAADFANECISKEGARPKTPRRPLCRDVRAEKGHLVPRSLLTAVFGTDVRPTETHEINGIGNLTYMSRDFNRGLDNELPDLSIELGHFKENLGRHFLVDGTSVDAYLAYESVRKALNGGVNAKKIQRDFRKLTEARRTSIHRAFDDWLTELDARSAKASGGTLNSRLDPEKPWFATDDHEAHVVRAFRLPDEDKQRILDLIRERPAEIGHGVVSVKLTKRHKQVSVSIRDSGVVLELRLLGERLRKEALKAVDVPWSEAREHELKPVPDFRPLISWCDQNEASIARDYFREREARKARQAASKTRKLRSEEDLWKMIRGRSQGAEPIARQLVEPFRQRPGFELSLGKSSLIVRVRVRSGPAELQLFFIRKDGKVEFWPKEFSKKAGKVGIAPGPVKTYVAGVKRLLIQGSGDDLCRRVQDVDIAALQTLAIEFQQKANA